jgi:hypothetical protein
MDMERHINKTSMHVLMCLIMPMLYSKIKFDIDVNNDNLLETIWEHMKQRKGGEILLH